MGNESTMRADENSARLLGHNMIFRELEWKAVDMTLQGIPYAYGLINLGVKVVDFRIPTQTDCFLDSTGTIVRLKTEV